VICSVRTRKAPANQPLNAEVGNVAVPDRPDIHIDKLAMIAGPRK
jgi:hypothetical protein